MAHDRLMKCLQNTTDYFAIFKTTPKLIIRRLLVIDRHGNIATSCIFPIIRQCLISSS